MSIKNLVYLIGGFEENADEYADEYVDNDNTNNGGSNTFIFILILIILGAIFYFFIYPKIFKKPVDCVVSKWTPWSTCSERCNTGSQSRTRTIAVAALNGGKSCPILTESEKCNTQPCPINCEGSWGGYGTCNKTCGGGTQTETYSIKTKAEYGGTACPTVVTNSRPCNTDECPIDCVGSWGPWGQCSKLCGSGVQTETYNIRTRAEYGGVACPTVLTKTRQCNTQSCPVNCIGSWGQFGDCSVGCGGGTQSEVYTIARNSAYGGTACPATNGQIKSQSCNTNPCPIDCVGSWGGWSNCSKFCGGGSKSQTFNITTNAAHGGAACSATHGQVNSQSCNNQNCVAAVAAAAVSTVVNTAKSIGSTIAGWFR